MVDYLADAARAFWSILVDSSPWLLGGFMIAGLIRAWVPSAWLKRQLGRRGVGSVVKAALVGAPMPLCSCSVIPTAAAVRRGGASKGASASFVVATPEVDLPAAALTWGLIGPAMAVARPVSAVVSAILAGLGVDAVTRADEQDPGSHEGSAAPTKSGCCHTKGTTDAPPRKPCCSNTGSDTPRSASFASGVMRALKYGFGDLPRDLGVWMVVGLALSALVAAGVRPGFLESFAGDGIAAKMMMLVVGVPVYVCATASTPLAAVLIAKGLSPGAALVFLLAGPATNPATMMWVLKDLGVRALGVYLTVIAGVALAAGIAVDTLLPVGWFTPESAHAHAHEHGTSAGMWSGVVLGVVLAVGVGQRVRSWMKRSGSEAPIPGGSLESA